MLLRLLGNLISTAPVARGTRTVLFTITNFSKKTIVFALLPFVGGCAVATISATGATMGVSYTMNNVAYKTFSYPVENVERATLEALSQMGFVVSQFFGLDRRIEATAKDLNIEITVEHITSKTTQMTVDAKKGLFLKDKATALEIISQVAKILDPQFRREIVGE